MRTFTKLFSLVLILTISTTLFAQKSVSSYVGNSAPDKMEMIRQIHGSGVTVPISPEGITKATGDDCTSPIEINALPFSDLNQTTTGRGNNYNATCLNDFDGGEDIIYRLEVTSLVTINVSLDPKGTPRTGIALSDGCPLSSLCLAMSYDLYNGGAVAHGFTVSLEPGFYYIMVDTWPNPTSIANFDLSITQTSTVANDFCSTATEVGEVLNLPFSTEFATDDPSGETFGPEVWFDYVAGFTGIAAIDLCGSDYDTYMIVWDGAACPPTTILDDNDDFCGYDGLQSKVFIPVVQGNTYKIEIGGFDGATGEGLLSIYEYEECTLTCPPGGISENEPCGANTNGGCNMATPAFTNVSNGNTICGNLWSQYGTRDTDWFRVVLNSPGSIKMTATAEQSVVFGMVGQIVPGLPGCDNTTNFLTAYKILPACQEDFVYLIDLPKGTYYMFIAPMNYFDHVCPGFSYQASFEFEELASGFINGAVIGSDSGLPIQGVKMTAGDATMLTLALGNYSLEVPVGTYTVEADGYNVGYNSKEVLNVVVTENNFTTVNFILDPLEAPVLLTAVADIEQVELTWAEIGAKAEGGKALMGDIFSKNDYVPGTAMDLDFTMAIYSPDFEWGVYAEMIFPAQFIPLAATDLNGVAGVIDGQKVSWTGLFYENSYPEEFDFSVEVAVSGSASGPLVIEYYVEGDGYGLDPHFFNGALTVYEDGGVYEPTFNVYRRKIIPGTTTYFIPIAYGVIGNYYFDEIYPGGDEWCYLVKQIMPDKTESPASNILCATPVVRPGSLCEYAIDYGAVNSPAIFEWLVREDDVRWFEFDVPYTMDVAVTLSNTNFNADVTLFADCDGTLVTNSQYCGGDVYDVEKIYSMLPGGTYYARVSGMDDEYGDFEIFITQAQLLTILDGWSGFSTYMNPAGNLNIANQLACFKDDMVITIRQTPYGIWWPSQNINTLGNISSMIGYKAKMEVEKTTVIFGTENPDKTVALPAGASYLPVRVTAPTSTSSLISQLSGKLLILYDIHNPTGIIWPDGGLYLLDYLVPDRAYLINMFVASSYTYPMPSMAPAPNVTYPPAPAKLAVWNDVTNTGQPHFISIQKDALANLETGDFIGIFNAQNQCVGMTEFATKESNLFIPAFGDDETSEAIDGLAAGERMIFKIYRPSNGYTYELDVTYSEEMPNSDGLFEVHGMSMIVDLKVGSTSISDGQLSSVAIYPNPTTGLLTITGIDGQFDVTVTNVQGQQILRSAVTGQATLDLSNQPKGIYFVRLTSDNSSLIEKVVIK